MKLPHDCEVRILPKMGWDAMDIWFIQYDNYKRIGTVIYPDGTTVEYSERDPIPNPSITMSARTMRNFLQAAKEEVVPSESMNDHLKDAIKVRDRLLAMIERIGK